MTPAEIAMLRAEVAALKTKARALEEFLDAQEQRTASRRVPVKPPARPVDEVNRARMQRMMRRQGIVPTGDDDAA